MMKVTFEQQEIVLADRLEVRLAKARRNLTQPTPALLTRALAIQGRKKT